ncbi:alkaline phosphatase family protein [Gluconacetobacter tumulisoli]|uniref:Phospholipase n=1 Tax=Gluconacetobacter tumulisoli TaxID=1286189 RepID=A0A7W4KAB7_9PROT|nr:alkaline phosphatase family protein [Gluconacetobacter tumulisoli]MBB2203264.1 phospholipase [Gluconacetobacter tumulisoli]
MDKNDLPNIDNVVVLMLENRSFDCMLGELYGQETGFDGLKGTEYNTWHKPDGSREDITVWSDSTLSPASIYVPTPDPGESFDDIHMQIHGLRPDGTVNPDSPTMKGFVDNYMRLDLPKQPDPQAAMHYFTPIHVPVISQLARAFGVSDRWFASAPCQTWPNRFFVHTGTAGGYVNNTPAHIYTMETVFNRLADKGKDWRIYFHDFPQSATLMRLWESPERFRRFDDDFATDVKKGRLPAYTFIEPRYFADLVGNHAPNDQHPPHNVAYGEALIASVYNALRAGPKWKQTLFIITYDEHGGCFDHVVPPAATPPGGTATGGFRFDYYGVRVPAVIVSPYIKKGSFIRPPSLTPFDHTSIIATLRKLFGIEALTLRDMAAPDILSCMTMTPDNDGPPSVTPASWGATEEEVTQLRQEAPNELQSSLAAAACLLPPADTDSTEHVARLKSSPPSCPQHATARDAASAANEKMRAFLGGR